MQTAEGIVLLTTSIGEVEAIPARRMTPPARGLDFRPAAAAIFCPK